MSQERKILKILCFLLVVCAVACVVLGVTALLGSGSAAADLQAWSLGLGVWGVAEGALGLLLSGAGIRGANTPRRAGAVKVPGIVVAVLAAAGAAASAARPDGPDVATLVAAVAALALAVGCVVLSGKVDEQAQR